jgi:hypothetical protein
MPYACAAAPCSLDLDPQWTVEEVPEANGNYAFVAIRPPAKDALLRFTTFERAGVEAGAWTEAVAHVNRSRGRPVVPVSCGGFSGYRTQFTPGDGRLLRGWALHAGAFPLDVTYACAVEDAGRDDAAVEAMLATLELRTGD